MELVPNNVKPTYDMSDKKIVDDAARCLRKKALVFDDFAKASTRSELGYSIFVPVLKIGFFT